MLVRIGEVHRVAELMARHVLNDLNPEEIQELCRWKAITVKHSAIFSELTDTNRIVAYLENRMLI